MYQYMNIFLLIFQASLSFMATSSSPLLGLFILGGFFTRSNWLVSIISSVYVLFNMLIQSNLQPVVIILFSFSTVISTAKEVLFS